MIINTNRETLDKALERTNREFEGNVIYNRIDRLSDNRHRVTLKVKDSKAPGARRGYTGRRMISACWHAHGVFFDSLPEGTKIHTGGQTVHAGDAWQDRNIGSIVYPMMYSEACDCGIDL